MRDDARKMIVWTITGLVLLSVSRVNAWDWTPVGAANTTVQLEANDPAQITYGTMKDDQDLAVGMSRYKIYYTKPGEHNTGIWFSAPFRTPALPEWGNQWAPFAALGRKGLTFVRYQQGGGYEGGGRLYITVKKAPGINAYDMNLNSTGVNSGWNPGVPPGGDNHCSVSAGNIDLGKLPAHTVNGAHGTTAVRFQCENAGSVRVTAKSADGQSHLIMDNVGYLIGKIDVGGNSPQIGEVVEVPAAGAGGVSTIGVTLQDGSGGRTPAGVYRGQIVVTLTFE